MHWRVRFGSESKEIHKKLTGVNLQSVASLAWKCHVGTGPTWLCLDIKQGVIGHCTIEVWVLSVWYMSIPNKTELLRILAHLLYSAVLKFSLKCTFKLWKVYSQSILLCGRLKALFLISKGQCLKTYCWYKQCNQMNYIIDLIHNLCNTSNGSTYLV